MQGLVNRAIQRFVVDSYGASKWVVAARRAKVGFVDFEPMLNYDDELTERVLDAVCEVLDRSRNELMEDIGTYLVSHPNLEPLRRLLRFGGVDFLDFLHSLDDLPDRARLAVSGLVLPQLELRQVDAHAYCLTCVGNIPGSGHLFMGVLRGMADDYGALVFLDYRGQADGVETISVALLDTEFAEGRGFELSAQVS
ncbi:heme NO-binding domain-containing protein [Roseobacter sp.]|uniref:heme NO-binding domain-containing protein n=1 Tax=Roseobacter sp. TaxID=1907202 RepID=UPI0032979604